MTSKCPMIVQGSMESSKGSFHGHKRSPSDAGTLTNELAMRRTKQDCPFASPRTISCLPKISLPRPSNHPRKRESTSRSQC